MSLKRIGAERHNLPFHADRPSNVCATLIVLFNACRSNVQEVCEPIHLHKSYLVLARFVHVTASGKDHDVQLLFQLPEGIHVSLDILLHISLFRYLLPRRSLIEEVDIS